MPHRSTMFTGNSFLTTYLRVICPDWGPLERTAALVRQRRDLPWFHPGEFMYMTAVRGSHRQLTIHLYKHIDTRRYLNLDDAGHAYAFVPRESDPTTHESSGRYRRYASLPDALDGVGLYLFETNRLRRSFPPEDWPSAG